MSRTRTVVGALVGAGCLVLAGCGGESPAVNTVVLPTFVSTSTSTSTSSSSSTSASSSTTLSPASSASGTSATTDESVPSQVPSWPGGDSNQQTQTVNPEDANLSDIKTELEAYYQSGRYEADIAAMITRAQRCMLEAAQGVAQPALVLDIDETALSNYTWMVSVDFLRNSPLLGQLFAENAANEDTPAIPATLQLYQAARAAGITVFFITGRSQALQAVTETNLRNVGYTEFGPSAFTAVGSSYASAADFKAPARAALEAQGYTIVANIGDQNSDLEGGHGQCLHKLPDPFYYIP